MLDNYKINIIGPSKRFSTYFNPFSNPPLADFQHIMRIPLLNYSSWYINFIQISSSDHNDDQQILHLLQEFSAYHMRNRFVLNEYSDQCLGLLLSIINERQRWPHQIHIKCLEVFLYLIRYSALKPSFLVKKGILLVINQYFSQISPYDIVYTMQLQSALSKSYTVANKMYTLNMFPFKKLQEFLQFDNKSLTLSLCNILINIINSTSLEKIKNKTKKKNFQFLSGNYIHDLLVFSTHLLSRFGGEKLLVKKALIIILCLVKNKNNRTLIDFSDFIRPTIETNGGAISLIEMMNRTLRCSREELALIVLKIFRRLISISSGGALEFFDVPFITDNFVHCANTNCYKNLFGGGFDLYSNYKNINNSIKVNNSIFLNNCNCMNENSNIFTENRGEEIVATNTSFEDNWNTINKIDSIDTSLSFQDNNNIEMVTHLSLKFLLSLFSSSAEISKISEILKNSSIIHDVFGILNSEGAFTHKGVAVEILVCLLDIVPFEMLAGFFAQSLIATLCMMFEGKLKSPIFDSIATVLNVLIQGELELENEGERVSTNCIMSSVNVDVLETIVAEERVLVRNLQKFLMYVKMGC